MILQRLVDYYHRQSANSTTLATEGFEKKEIPFLIVVDLDGTFKGLIDTRSGEGKKKQARVFDVPRGVKKTVNIAANLLWDNVGYVLGIDAKGKPNQGKPDRVVKQKEAFLARIIETFPEPRDESINAIINFYQRGQDKLIENDLLFAELKESTGNISFCLQGELSLICQRAAVQQVILQSGRGEQNSLDTCLITGELDELTRLHTSIKGVWGAQTAGANIVSFNLAAFNSYGKAQGLNAPIGKRAEFAYTTALNSLLAKGSRQRLNLGSDTVVFWAAQAHKMEDWLLDLWGGESSEDSFSDDGEAIRSLYAAPKTGARPLGEDPTPFYVLGLAPNAARISIRFWHDTTVGLLATNIRQHFDDMRIAHGPKEPEYLPLINLLKATAVLSKKENILPNLAGDIMKAILDGTLYPYTLLTNVLLRTRSNKNVCYTHAALIKAVLNRSARLTHQPEKEISVSLDEKCLDCSYLMGRLFAVLERAQEAAQPGINATIKDRFYGAASTTPVTVFPYLLKLKNHHIAKLTNKAQAIYLEKQIGQIMDGLMAFPAHMSLPEQGRFAIGYYHQRQDFFTKKEKEIVAPTQP